MFDIRDLIVAAGIALFVGGFSGFYVTHKIDAATLEHAQKNAADKTTAALFKALGDLKELDTKERLIAVAEATAQRVLITRTETITKEVIRHVPVSSSCVPLGFVRVLDAEAGGAASADELPLPAGVTDADCAPVTYPALATHLVKLVGICRANSIQLDALASAAIVTSAPPTPRTTAP